MDQTTQDRVSSMPDEFDRTLGLLHDLPDVVRTDESITRVMPFMGVGGSKMFIVQTVRQRHDKGSKDTIFLEVTGPDFHVRLVVPPEVSSVIHRQYDALTAKARRKGARQAVETRKERGIEPGFLKKKRRKA